MKTHQCFQTIAFFSLLCALSPTAANPLPDGYDISNLDYTSFLNSDDLGLSGTNPDDAGTPIFDQSNQGDQWLSSDPAGTTDLLNLNPIDGSLIAYGSSTLLKAPYCGTTEQPVCCADPSNFRDCKFCKNVFTRPTLANEYSFRKFMPICGEKFTRANWSNQLTRPISKTAKEIIKDAVLVSSE